MRLHVVRSASTSDAACCMLSAARCLLRVALGMLHAACCMPPAACCMPPAACCMPPAACCMLHAARCMLHVACRPLHVAYCGRWCGCSVGLGCTSTCSAPAHTVSLVQALSRARSPREHHKAKLATIVSKDRREKEKQPNGRYKGLFSEALARNSADLMWMSSTFGLAVDR
jgi:hypothetical protein